MIDATSNTENDQPRPSLERLFLVAVGVGDWTDVERSWIEQHPQYAKLEQQFREWAERLNMRGAMTNDQLFAAAEKVLGPYQDQLEQFLAEETLPDEHDFSMRLLMQLVKDRAIKRVDPKR